MRRDEDWDSAWGRFARLTAIDSVRRDPRPARAVVGVIMAAIALAAAMTIVVPFALKLVEEFHRVSMAISSI